MNKFYLLLIDKIHALVYVACQVFTLEIAHQPYPSPHLVGEAPPQHAWPHLQNNKYQYLKNLGKMLQNCVCIK